ncbi:efflux transporter periplasmic adaptor subunit [Spartobacteria bacterium LR76]|nr:efflux transporter periplasmic adaptor subunit [Spartobacteria bacterium LR76]
MARRRLRPGAMKSARAFAALGLVALLVSCEKKAEQGATAPVPVTVTPITQKDVYVSRTWVGLLNGYQNADIRAQVNGYLLTQNYKEGSLVKKGTILFTIDPRPFEAALAQAQADYAKAVAQATLAKVTLDRQTQLYKTKVISQQEYDTSYQQAQADFAAVAAQQAQVDTAQINLNYCTITAPFDGIVGLAQAQIGDLVGPSGSEAVLTQMSQVNPIKVNFSITEEQYLEAAPLLKKLQDTAAADLEARIQLRLADGKEYPELGKFDFVNRQVTSSTGTIQITALFPNDNDVLRPGLFGRITAPVQMLPDALVVPQASLVELQGKYFVGVLKPDNTVQFVPIKPGPLDGEYQVIDPVVKQFKLAAGDKVIVGGVEKVRGDVKVSPSAWQAPTPTPAPGASPTPTPAS